MNTTTNLLPATQNESWGFWGTMGGQASVAWPIALTEISKATGESPEDVRPFLDSRHGRHFADTVHDALAQGHGMHAAITRAIAQWMTWKISRQTHHQMGIPKGLPYLTGFVVHCNIEQE
jgi:hypothetical protein